jgi:putative transposase
MARLPRLVVPNHLHHIVARGNNDQQIVLDDADCHHFLSALRDSAQRSGVAIHAYVLMPSRIQLMATPSDAVGLGKLMQAVGRHYVPYFNARHGRSGNLWEGRFRATVMEADTYFLACAQLIEQQPVVAGIVADPLSYGWSSYAHHSGVRREVWLYDHPAYWALGNTPFEREAAYQQLVKASGSSELMAEIEAATRKAWPLGSEEFRRRLGKLTDRRLQPARRGRPRKQLIAENC